MHIAILRNVSHREAIYLRNCLRNPSKLVNQLALVHCRLRRDDLLQPRFKIIMNGGPPKLTSQLRRINCIAPIVTGAITHPIDEVTGLAHCLKNRLQDLKIIPLTIRANQISLPSLPSFRMVHTSRAWSSTGIQSQTFLPSPYNRGCLPRLMLSIAAGMNFSSFCSGP